MIYLDSSALLKLLYEEPESAALAAWLDTQRDTPKLTSALAEVEVLRACRRRMGSVPPAASILLAGLDLIPLTKEVLTRASDVGNATVGTLDAIHLASALSVGNDLSALVVYDRRLAEAASAASVTTVEPGA